MNHYQHQQQQQQKRQNIQMQQQVGSGLTRYQSAPSSYLTSLLDSTSSSGGFREDDFDQIFNTRASSPQERQQIFSRFKNSVDTTGQNYSSNMNLQSQSQFVPPIKIETEVHQPQQQLQRQLSKDYSSVSQMTYQSHNSGDAISAMDNSSRSRMYGSNNLDRVVHSSMDGGGCNSSLIRQSSLPAGLFTNINIDNDFGAMRRMGNFGAGDSNRAEALPSFARRFENQMVFPSVNCSSLGMMTPISGIGSKSFGETHPGDGHFQEYRANDENYITGFPDISWNDSSIMSDDFMKGLGDDDTKTFSNINALDDQNSEGGNRPTTLLSHHLSLPSSIPKISAMEKMLQDSVPCKTRAKRGCATHPRSIAERVRRTRISERMRKLHELVPNMEKQTNTSDMLDLAVDYIKDLQTQVKVYILKKLELQWKQSLSNNIHC